MEFEGHQLANGIRIIHKHVPSLIAHTGIIINTGSRDEKENEHGLAHFIEHVFFKGTTKRRAHHVLARMEDVGGEINAYTTKEETCVYTSFMTNHYNRALELLSDIVFNSVFPEKELQREKEIVLDEINSYKDSPSDLIFDDFEEVVFKNNSLGRNILGTRKQLNRFSKEHIRFFLQNNYHTDQIVVASVGNIKFERLIKLAERYFGIIPKNTRKHSLREEPVYMPAHLEVKKKTHQAHCILGNIAYNLTNENRLGLYLLNNLLGGPGLSSRLNISLREKNGFSYNPESSYTPYSDTGLFSVYFGTDRINLQKSLTLVKKEFKKLRETPLSKIQLQKAKRQLLGQIAIGAENHENLMLNMGKSYLIYNKVDSFEEVKRKIDAIDAIQIRSIANNILNEEKLSYLIY
ncbi:MAG: M16 family metallopeptidase, partial [Bacteroidota bacterium]